MINRNEIIAGFLAQHGFVAVRLLPLAQDASYRRYWRLADGPWPAVLMDAPPPEDICAFLRVAMHLAGLGLSVPEVRAADSASGLLLEEDLGDAMFSVTLTEANQAELFGAAVDVLAIIHKAAPPSGLPPWGAAEMAEAALGTIMDWWWPAMFSAPAPDQARADLAAALADMLAPLAAGPTGFVHRDFFAGNLIWLPERAGPRRVGVLDFQSAAIGHPAYDVASLTEDARRDFSPALAERGIARYLAARPELNPDSFRAAIAICAAQRHLRVAGQWVRLARRDGKPHYLAHGARTWGLLESALRAPEAAALAEAMDRWISARAPPQSTRDGGMSAPRTAMVLAAGLGTRMRPLTDNTAKPLLPLAGRSLLDHALDRLAEVGVELVVVNAHWQAERVGAVLAARQGGPHTILQVEDELLETGGGVLAALDQLGPAPFYVVNGDAFWLNGPRPALARLADAFDPAAHDAVLLVQRSALVSADIGFGDFALDRWGQLRRRGEREVVPYIYAGAFIMAPALLDGFAQGKFSLNRPWDRALAIGRLGGIVHDGLWFHLSTPRDLAEAEAALHAR